MTRHAISSAASPLESSQQLVRSLAAMLDARVVETHISWVLLAGRDAYKIKKPVRTEFLDYASLEARRQCCEQELAVNQRLAGAIYLGVQPITGTPESPEVGGAGRVLEYAVHMRRFAESAVFGGRLERGELGADDIDALARRLGTFHQGSSASRGQDFASPALRLELALAALDGASAAAPFAVSRQVHDWLQEQARSLEALWRLRIEQGRVRECHGDLHLDNILRADGEVLAFDAIEFDARLRWIDVLDDVAFPFMDLAARGRTDWAFRLLSGWLDVTGDHSGLPALRFAASYRALVRAHVYVLRGGHRELARQYMRAATRWTAAAPLQLTIMHGLPGSGKTWLSQALMEQQGAIRVRSDVERKRLFGLGMLDSSAAAGLDIYGAAATEATYARVMEAADAALAGGFPVILDAAFLRRAERDGARELARRHAAQFTIASCEAPDEVLRERLRSRTGDASEADEAVLTRLAGAADAIDAREEPFVERHRWQTGA